MQSEKTLLDDLARLATGALGVLGDAKGEVEQRVRAQLERILARMKLPTREEIDAVHELAAAARTEADALRIRVVALEAKLGIKQGPRGAAAKRDSRASPRSAKKAMRRPAR